MKIKSLLIDSSFASLLFCGSIDLQLKEKKHLSKKNIREVKTGIESCVRDLNNLGSRIETEKNWGWFVETFRVGTRSEKIKKHQLDISTDATHEDAQRLAAGLVGSINAGIFTIFPRRIHRVFQIIELEVNLENYSDAYTIKNHCKGEVD